MTIAELMIPELDREMARTRKVLAKVPAESLEWQAHPSLHTLGWNANHVAEIAGWTVGIVEHDEFDIAPVDGPKYATPALTDPAEILAAFDANVAAARAALVGVSDETMARPWSMKMGGQTLFTLSKGDCLRTWIFNHTVHHRAMLSAYLRILGVKLTPIYDE